jgi:hypothetical protein
VTRKFALAAAVATGLTLGVALPAAATPTVVAVAQDPITEADVEAKAAEFEVVIEALAAEAEGIRADASLSDEQKNARIDAAIAAKQPEIDAFLAYLEAFIRQEAGSEGMDAAQTDMVVDMIRSQFAQLPAALKSGEFSGMGG